MTELVEDLTGKFRESYQGGDERSNVEHIWSPERRVVIDDVSAVRGR
jgi:hypothetical protein